jgi:hypothetical protein
MSEELTPRIYREYCWFALVLFILAIGIIDRPAPPALAPPAHQTP